MSHFTCILHSIKIEIYWSSTMSKMFNDMPCKCRQDVVEHHCIAHANYCLNLPPPCQMQYACVHGIVDVLQWNLGPLTRVIVRLMLRGNMFFVGETTHLAKIVHRSTSYMFLTLNQTFL